MNIKLTNAEAVSMIQPLMSDRFYPASVVVQIAPDSVVSTYTPPLVQDRLSFIRSAFRRGENGYLNKIGMIKEVRTLTGWGLKDAKDFIEAMLDGLIFNLNV